MILFANLLFSSTIAQHFGQNLVLYALHRAGLGQSLGVQCHAETLVDLNRQLDGHNRGESCITQDGSNAKILVSNDLCDNGMDFLLQHIHRNIASLLDS